MFSRSDKGYKPVLNYDLDEVQSTTMGSYQLPSGLGTYTKRGIEYQDIEDNMITISPERIPDFLRTVCAAETPWTQGAFATLFYDSNTKQSMSGIEDVEEKLKANPIALMDYRLMLLGARAAQIQIAKVGSDRHALLCPESKELIKLYKSLRDEFKNFQEKIAQLEKSQAPSRHRSKTYAKYEKEFKFRMDQLVNPYLDKYKKDWDTRNIMLNVLAVASIVGLIRLIFKNAVSIYRGKHLGLFQFEAAYSKNIEAIEQLSSDNLVTSFHVNVQNFFTQNKSDTLRTIQELQQILKTLDSEIKAFQSTHPQRNVDHLLQLHASLSKSVGEFASELKTPDEKLNDEYKREVAEALFIGSWCDAIPETLGTYESRDDYPAGLRNVIDDIQLISDQLSEEFNTSDRFKLYSNQR